MTRQRQGSPARRQLVVVTGKGGVGKTTVAAAIAHLLARAGLRVLALEVDPREHMHRLFDTEPSDGAIVAVGEGVWHQNLDPRTEIDALVRVRVPVGVIAKAVLASPVYHHFVEGAPGLKALAVLGHAMRLVRGEIGPGVDVVVLDAPATGHGVALLAAPLLVSEVVTGGPVGHLAQEIAEFTADPTRSAVVITTLAEEMPVQEAIELIALLETRIEREPELVVVNGLYPPGPPRSANGDPAIAVWRQRRAVNEQERDRLAAHWPGPLAELPLVALGSGPDLVADLAARLKGSVERMLEPA